MMKAKKMKTLSALRL